MAMSFSNGDVYMVMNDSLDFPLLNEKEFAKAVGLAPVTIRKRRRQGELSFYRFGRAIRYSRAMVEEFKRKHEWSAAR
jgi:excisionase family DNA binding protein